MNRPIGLYVLVGKDREILDQYSEDQYLYVLGVFVRSFRPLLGVFVRFSLGVFVRAKLPRITGFCGKPDPTEALSGLRKRDRRYPGAIRR